MSWRDWVCWQDSPGATFTFRFELESVPRTKKPAAIAPLLPLTFVVAYQADLAYGTKLNRIKWVLSSSSRKITFLVSELSLRTSWCTRGTWLICRLVFLLWLPLVWPPTLNYLPVSINRSIHQTKYHIWFTNDNMLLLIACNIQHHPWKFTIIFASSS